MIVRIPTPLRSYTGGASSVNCVGHTVGEVMDDLDRQFPGLRFRVINEQGQLRQHMKIFVGMESTKDLSRRLSESDEVTLMQALSGG